MSTVHSSGHGLISARKFHLHRCFGTWTFCLHRRFCKETIRNVSFSAQVLFGMGTFQYWNIYFSTGAKMSVPKWPYCFVWCRPCAEIFLCRNVPLPKMSLCRNVLMPKSPCAKTSSSQNVHGDRMFMCQNDHRAQSLCRKLSCQNVRYQY